MQRAVVLTGLVRNEPLLLEFLGQYAQLPPERRVPLYFSTWFRELDKYPQARAALNAADAYIIEQNEPDLVLPGHALHQMICLDIALSVIGPGTFVLRSRPDFATIQTYENFMAVSPSPVGAGRIKYPGQKQRYHAWAAMAAHPFYINDINIAGLSEDMRLLADWPMASSLRYHGVAPEQIIWGGALLQRVGVLDTYFRANLGLIFNNPALNSSVRSILIGSPLFAQALAAYYEILDNSFCELNIHVPDFAEHASRVTLEQCLWEPTDLPSLHYNPAAQVNAVQTMSFAAAVRNRRLRPSALLDAVSEAGAALKPMEQMGAAESHEAMSRARDLARAFEGLGLFGHKAPVGHTHLWGIHSASANWRQTGERTSREIDLEREVNRLRRTVDDLNHALGLAKGAS